MTPDSIAHLSPEQVRAMAVDGHSEARRAEWAGTRAILDRVLREFATDGQRTTFLMGVRFGMHRAAAILARASGK